MLLKAGVRHASLVLAYNPARSMTLLGHCWRNRRSGLRVPGTRSGTSVWSGVSRRASASRRPLRNSPTVSFYGVTLTAWSSFCVCAVRWDKRSAEVEDRSSSSAVPLMPVVRGSVPGQGLPTPPDCDRVRSGHDPAAALPLRRLWWGGSWCRLAGALPIEA